MLDVRLAPLAAFGSRRPLVAVGFVVGVTGRPGSLLGYERSPEQGPWLVAHVVRWLHRRTDYVPWADVAAVTFATNTLRLRDGAPGPGASPLESPTHP